MVHGDPQWIEGITQESAHAPVHKLNYINIHLSGNGVSTLILLTS